MSAAIMPIVVVMAILATAGWMYTDATRRECDGRPVVWDSEYGSLDTPATWAIACTFLCVIIAPLYLAARRT